MIDHVVMFTPKAGLHSAELTALMEEFAALVGKIAGFEDFRYGENRGFEKDRTGPPCGFVCQFTDEDAFWAYCADPRHKALGARLVAMVSDGADGLIIFDRVDGPR